MYFFCCIVTLFVCKGSKLYPLSVNLFVLFLLQCHTFRLWIIVKYVLMKQAMWLMSNIACFLSDDAKNFGRSVLSRGAFQVFQHLSTFFCLPDGGNRVCGVGFLDGPASQFRDIFLPDDVKTLRQIQHFVQMV